MRAVSHISPKFRKTKIINSASLFVDLRAGYCTLSKSAMQNKVAKAAHRLAGPVDNSEFMPYFEMTEKKDLKTPLFCHRPGEIGGMVIFRPVWIVLIMYFRKISATRGDYSRDQHRFNITQDSPRFVNGSLG